MVEKTRTLFRELEELIDMACKDVDFRTMSNDDFKAIKLVLMVEDSLKDVMLKQAYMLEDMNKKLDKLVDYIDLEN